jgi:hypothetical protein
MSCAAAVSCILQLVCVLCFHHCMREPTQISHSASSERLCDCIITHTQVHALISSARNLSGINAKKRVVVSVSLTQIMKQQDFLNKRALSFHSQVSSACHVKQKSRCALHSTELTEIQFLGFTAFFSVALRCSWQEFVSIRIQMRARELTFHSSRVPLSAASAARGARSGDLSVHLMAPAQ